MLLKRFCFSRVIHKPDGLILGLIICLLLSMPTSKGQSQETDLGLIIRAMPGDDVVLPCHVEPPKDPSKITVEWGRPDLKPRFVHVWHNQKEFLADQNKAYRGRTSLFNDKLKDGDLSLKLSNVRHSDNGRYRCHNPAVKTEYFVELLVVSVSSPGISLVGLDVSSRGVMLDCSSGSWFPEPTIIWLDGEENIMSAGLPEKMTGPDGLYIVSSRVTVEKRHNNNITCRVQQKDINQTRETHIYLPDDFFIHKSDCSVCISFIVILILMLVFGIGFLIWMKQQNKKKKRNTQPTHKVNEEKQQLITDVKLKVINVEQRNIDEQIQALMEISDELKEQKGKLIKEANMTEKMLGENEKNTKAVDEDITNQTGDKTNKKAQGYLQLKELLTENNGKLFERKQGHQELEFMTDKLMKRTLDEVNKLKKRKLEMENHLEEIKKQLDERYT